MDLNTIHHHDVAVQPWPIADKSVHCIITSPPYWGLRDYGVKAQSWPEITYSPMAGLAPITIPPMECCLGLEKTIEAFVGHLVYVFREAKRILRNDGNLWVNMGDSYNGSGKGKGDKTVSKQTTNKGSRFEDRDITAIAALKPKDLIGQPWRIAFALQADGWYLRKDNIWSKPNPMPESCQDRTTTAHEYIFHFSLSQKYYYDTYAVREKATTNEDRPGGVVRDREYDYNTKRKNNPTAYLQKNGKQRGIVPGKETQPQFGNGEWDAMTKEQQGTGGRNKRSVWHMATHPFPEAHFATFPEKLPETCILAGTSAYGVCADCGAPWKRITEPSAAYAEKPGKSWNETKDIISGNSNGKAASPEFITTGWSPTCKCGTEKVVPTTVCDIFMGAGTTAKVALRLMRTYTGMEINADYIRLANKRLASQYSVFNLPTIKEPAYTPPPLASIKH